MSTPASNAASPFLGIDFGTTKTMVAEHDPVKGYPRVHKLGRGSLEMPTSIYISEKGQRLFGDDADDEGLTDREGYKEGFKMDLGKSGMSHHGRGAGTAVDLTGQFLTHIRHLLETQVLHTAPDRVILTVPAMFGPAQRQDLTRAARDAGFKEVELLEEPAAAGIAFCHHHRNLADHVRFLVVDWGGGTFDVALVEREANQKVKIHRNIVSGLLGIGGRDLDDDLWVGASERVQANGHGSLDAQPSSKWGTYRRDINRAKEKLSLQESVKVSFTPNVGNPWSLQLERTDLETIISEKVRKGVSFVTEIVERCRKENSTPEFIVLAGGTSKIPMVERLLTEATGLKCLSWTEGREAIALGAALHAHQLWGGTPTQNQDANSSSTDKIAACLRYRKLLEAAWINGRITLDQRIFLGKERRSLGLSQAESEAIQVEVFGTQISNVAENPSQSNSAPISSANITQPVHATASSPPTKTDQINWYYQQGTRTVGPVNTEAMTDLIRSNHLLAETLVRTETTIWGPLRERVLWDSKTDTMRSPTNSSQSKGDGLEWYYMQGGKKMGPFTTQWMNSLRKNDYFKWDDMVTTSGNQSNWIRICETPIWKSNTPVTTIIQNSTQCANTATGQENTFVKMAGPMALRIALRLFGF